MQNDEINNKKRKKKQIKHEEVEGKKTFERWKKNENKCTEAS